MQWVSREGQISLLGRAGEKGAGRGKEKERKALNGPIVRNDPPFTFTSLATCCSWQESSAGGPDSPLKTSLAAQMANATLVMPESAMDQWERPSEDRFFLCMVGKYPQPQWASTP